MPNFESPISMSTELFNSLERVDKVVWNGSDFSCVVPTSSTSPPSLTTTSTLAPTTSTLPPTTSTTPVPTTTAVSWVDPTVVISGPSTLAPFTREVVTLTVNNPSNYSLMVTEAVSGQTNYLNASDGMFLAEVFSATGNLGTYRMALAFDLFTDAEGRNAIYPSGSVNNNPYTPTTGTYSYFIYNDGAIPVDFELSFNCAFTDNDGDYRTFNTNHLNIRYEISPPVITNVSPDNLKYGQDVEFEISNYPLTLLHTSAVSNGAIIEDFKNNFVPDNANHLYPTSDGDYWINPFVSILTYYFKTETIDIYWDIVVRSGSTFSGCNNGVCCSTTFCNVESTNLDGPHTDSNFTDNVSPMSQTGQMRLSGLFNVGGNLTVNGPASAFDNGNDYNFKNYVKIIDHKTVRLKFPTKGFPTGNKPSGAYAPVTKEFQSIAKRCKINLNVLGVESTSTSEIINLKNQTYPYTGCFGFVPQTICS